MATSGHKPTELQQFYIPEEQSVYLLSQSQARQLREWIGRCRRQLAQVGYREVELVGKGAYGFVFAGIDGAGDSHVFKFTRQNLPQSFHERLEEEAFMLEQVDHPRVPKLIAYRTLRHQAMLVMARAPGINLEEFSLREGRLAPRLVIKIAAQLADILRTLRRESAEGRLVVHGDIKPSNLMFDARTEQIALIDWGSSVFAQLDAEGQFLSRNVMELMSADLQHTNARMGDVYYIGGEQLEGALSSPRFDEQGAAATLYALATAQSSRFGRETIPATSLGLPIEFARVLDAMLSEDPALRRRAGDYFLQHMPRIARTILRETEASPETPLVPVWVRSLEQEIETVVYSSRKAFLRDDHRQDDERNDTLSVVNDVQLDRYYKHFMQGMGDLEKAFLVAVGRLGKYPVVGGLAVRWSDAGVEFDTTLSLNEPSLRKAFVAAVNNMVTLARAIRRRDGVFKACLFNARRTLHVDRDDASRPFVPDTTCAIPYEVSPTPELEDASREHSYFEDGPDPEEFLRLPPVMIEALSRLNAIHHTGMIIFEALPTHLKIHSYYRLLDPAREEEFRDCLETLLAAVPQIDGLGVSGYMKMPYKNTRHFAHRTRLANSGE
ncbi:MAG: serine/threonine protein kinase [Salinicola sp.]|uniref:protein kinase domain-containing protein n=1 Tax=uncultured Salinicola sp. TaxID=1193542 RepID=UPI000C94434D|nr:phosphotransferase [uncultured Salinicola sp.]MAM58950.1 serine/threonine protein kinase [Salinicola sp.]